MHIFNLLLLIAEISGLIIKRGVCFSFPCMDGYSSRFEDMYELGPPVSGISPVFKCTEIETGIEHICKFPRLEQTIDELPAEITVLNAIKNSNMPEKNLFVNMKKFFYLKRKRSDFPPALMASNFFKNYIDHMKRINQKIPEEFPIYVEILEYYDENWVDGAHYIRIFPLRTEYEVIHVFRQLVRGIRYLYALGYAHSDIKRNI